MNTKQFVEYIDNLLYEASNNILNAIKDNRIDLTSNEFALLNVLAQHAGNALSREQLSFMLKGEDCAPEDRFIDVQVCRLRRLLENNPNKPTYLQTVRGIGYVLIPHMTLQ